MPHDHTSYQEYFSGLNFWRLCDELSLLQAALLIVGCDPSSEMGFAERMPMPDRPQGYEAAKAAISNGLRKGAITGKLVPLYELDFNGNRGSAIGNSVDINDSRVDVESLRAWLAGRGLLQGFFFPITTDAPDYLDPRNPRFAPKLAAAIRAWQAVTDPGKRSAKQALEKWLREHAAEFGLVDDDGNPVNQAVEDCSKVANWNPAGGAPKTPGA